MVSQTNEQALEAAIEEQLTGTCLEELKKEDKHSENKIEESQLPFGPHNGYELGFAREFNARFAVECIRHLWPAVLKR